MQLSTQQDILTQFRDQARAAYYARSETRRAAIIAQRAQQAAQQSQTRRETSALRQPYF